MVFTDAVNGWRAYATPDLPLAWPRRNRSLAHALSVLSWPFLTLYFHFSSALSVFGTSVIPRAMSQSLVLAHEVISRSVHSDSESPTSPSRRHAQAATHSSSHTHRYTSVLCRRRRARCGTRCCCSWPCKRSSSNAPSDPSSKAPLTARHVHRPRNRSRGSLS